MLFISEDVSFERIFKTISFQKKLYKQKALMALAIIKIKQI